MDAKTFGARLRAARELRGMTQQQVAAAAGITRGAIAQWEGGSTGKVDAEALLRAARVLHTTLDYLIEGRGDAVAEPAPVYGPFPPGLAAAWLLLTDAQRQALIDQATTQAAENRAILDELTRRQR